MELLESGDLCPPKWRDCLIVKPQREKQSYTEKGKFLKTLNS